MTTKPKTMNSAIIKAWAKKNKEAAKALGLRLFQNQKTPDKLKELPSLGEFEDSVQDWAITNPAKARILIMSMLKDFIS
jgi:hypothetical protein